MEVSAISSSELLKINEVAELVSVEPQSSFIDVVLERVDNINTSISAANDIAQRTAMGENIPSHEIMIAMEKARLELNMAIQVRNKLLDAYQEIAKMQI